ncbi:sensor histidine kinase [Enterococcus sp. AZ192]|uniref:sensor histidine kinase n=1 Tax=unclassified Enterococcus TaxID=2608891 RepID=UPI003D2BB271
MKIMWKNFLFSISVIFTVTTVSLVILYFVMPIYYEYTKLNAVEKEFNKITDELNQKSLEDIKGKIDKQLFEGQEAITLILSDLDGKIVHPYLGEGSNSLSIGLGDQGETKILDSSDVMNVELSELDRGKELISTIKDEHGTEYLLTGLFSLQPISDASAVLLQIYPFLLVIDFLIGGIAAFFYSRFSTKRIKQISMATNQMLSLDHTIKCEIKGKDELALLAQDINQLDQTLLTTIDALKAEVAKVEGIERSKAEFMRVTSHELKTPVASLMGIIDGMIYNVGKFKDREHYLAVCKEILQQQADMIQNVLTVSKLDMFSLEETNQEVFSLKEVIEDKLKTYRLLAEVNQVELVVHLEECLIEGNKDEIGKVINNLLSNAFRYTKVNGQIDLFLDQHTLVIENQAVKVLSKAELSQIFEPFYRPDFSRNRETGGSGLGLFIVKQILDKQGWNFSFKELEGTRMCFSIYFDTERVII